MRPGAATAPLGSQWGPDRRDATQHPSGPKGHKNMRSLQCHMQLHRQHWTARQACAATQAAQLSALQGPCAAFAAGLLVRARRFEAEEHLPSQVPMTRGSGR